MRRAFLLLMVMAAGVGVLSLPTVPPVESSTLSEARPVSSAGPYAVCPWALADGTVDSTISVLVEEGSAQISFPVAGEVLAATGPISAGAYSLSSIVSAGITPPVVEFTAPVGAAAVLGTTSATSCRAGFSGPSVVAGGTTLDEAQLQLVLFNPFPQDATVEIRVYGNNGPEPVSSFEALTVSARSTRTFDMDEMLPSRQVLAFVIDDPSFQVQSALVQQGVDSALWSGVDQSESWEFPVLAVEGWSTKLVLVNDSAAAVAFTVELVFGEGISGSVAARSVLELELEEPSALEVLADGPLGAFVILVGADREYAASAGLPRRSDKWLLPGAGTGGRSAVWLFNSGSEPVTVTAVSLGLGGEQQLVRSYEVDSSSSRRLVVLTRVAGLLLEGDGFFTAGWLQGPMGGTSLAMGVSSG